MSDRGHRFTDHTADIAIEAWAQSESDLLVEAARALIAVLTEGAQILATDHVKVRVEAMDPEDRLVCWLNEVLWLAIGSGFLLSDAELALEGNGLTATLLGEPNAAARILTEVKSATYHDLRLAREQSGRYVARVVIDV